MAGQSWAQLYFIENKGMAWGWELGGEWGKMILTLFRLAAVLFGTWYIGKIVRQKYSKGFIVCAGLIYAGALGNLIDSLFYGILFDKGMMYDLATKDLVYYYGVAHMSGHGYASFLHGNVVDMLYFPMITRGNNVLFFNPIFNIADASISIGVITLLIFQKRFLRHQHDAITPPLPEHPTEETTNPHVI